MLILQVRKQAHTCPGPQLQNSLTVEDIDTHTRTRTRTVILVQEHLGDKSYHSSVSGQPNCGEVRFSALGQISQVFVWLLPQESRLVILRNQQQTHPHPVGRGSSSESCSSAFGSLQMLRMMFFVCPPSSPQANLFRKILFA